MEEKKIRLDIPANTYIKYYMKKQGYPLRQPCHGDGRCAECLIRIVRGHHDPSLTDILRLNEEALRQGWRLGCQAVTVNPVTIEFSPAQIKKKGEDNPLKKLFRKKP